MKIKVLKAYPCHCQVSHILPSHFWIIGISTNVNFSWSQDFQIWRCCVSSRMFPIKSWSNLLFKKKQKNNFHTINKTYAVWFILDRIQIRAWWNFWLDLKIATLYTYNIHFLNKGRLENNVKIIIFTHFYFNSFKLSSKFLISFAYFSK